MLVAYVADKNAGGAVVEVSTSSHCSRCSACIALSLRLSSLYSCFCCSFSVSKALLLDAYTAAEYCDERVCKSVCVCLSLCLSVRDHVLETTHPIFTNFFVHVTYGRGSVLLWRRSDKVRISGFIDDVIFAHKLRLLEVAARLR